MDLRNVSRVEIYAPVCSFRYPFFVTGRQPCYGFPPPSTIFGLTACAMGEWPNPHEFFFGAYFTYNAKGQDLEHQHITSVLGPRTKMNVETPGGFERASTTITVQPVLHDFLFGVKLFLYLPQSLGNAFKNPFHTLTLGRSQDLAEIIKVENIQLQRPQHVCLEHTILPSFLMPYINRGIYVQLSSFLTEPPIRYVYFKNYILIHDPIYYDSQNLSNSPSSFNPPKEVIPLEDFWCDIDFKDEDDFARGVWIHKIIT